MIGYMTPNDNSKLTITQFTAYLRRSNALKNKKHILSVSEKSYHIF